MDGQPMLPNGPVPISHCTARNCTEWPAGRAWHAGEGSRQTSGAANPEVSEGRDAPSLMLSAEMVDSVRSQLDCEIVRSAVWDQTVSDSLLSQLLHCGLLAS